MPWAQAAGGLLWTNHKYPAFGSPVLTLTQDGPTTETSVFNFTPQGGIGIHYFVDAEALDRLQREWGAHLQREPGRQESGYECECAVLAGVYVVEDSAANSSGLKESFVRYELLGSSDSSSPNALLRMTS